MFDQIGTKTNQQATSTRNCQCVNIITRYFDISVLELPIKQNFEFTL